MSAKDLQDELKNKLHQRQQELQGQKPTSFGHEFTWKDGTWLKVESNKQALIAMLIEVLKDT